MLLQGPWSTSALVSDNLLPLHWQSSHPPCPTQGLPTQTFLWVGQDPAEVGAALVPGCHVQHLTLGTANAAGLFFGPCCLLSPQAI